MGRWEGALPGAASDGGGGASRLKAGREAAKPACPLVTQHVADHDTVSYSIIQYSIIQYHTEGSCAPCQRAIGKELLLYIPSTVCAVHDVADRYSNTAW